MITRSWSEVNAVYQIYPRSFKDSNDDGVGDLRGVIEKLDYLSETLGVDAIWLSPFYPSPQVDCGYDVSDHVGVDPLFGNMTDFDELLVKAHDRGMKVMLDLVPNHVSDQHSWFKEARSSRDNPKRDWFVWRDTPNNWLSISGGPSWEYDEATEQYYLHSFMKSQPDLNWENPSVRSAVADIMRFWFNKGVDGFRVDAVWSLSKDPNFSDDPLNPDFSGPPDTYGAFIHSMSKNGPQAIEYLNFIASIASEYQDKRLLFEYYPDVMLGDIHDQLEKIHAVNPSIASPFYFEGVHMPWHAERFGRTLSKYLEIVPPEAWASFCFSNHDQPRIVSRFGEEQARLIAVLQFALPGMPVFYNGDEVGMSNGDVPPELTKDKFEKTGDSGGRDPYRIPMAWTSQAVNGGFSQATPWLPLNNDIDFKNVEAESGKEDSFLTLYQKLLEVRRDPVLSVGKFNLIDVHNGFVLAFERSLGGKKLYVVCNFADSEQEAALPEAAKQVLVESRPGATRLLEHSKVSIAGFGAVILTTNS